MHADGSGACPSGRSGAPPGPGTVDGGPRRGDHAARARRLAGMAFGGRAARAPPKRSWSTREARRTGSRSSSRPTRTAPSARRPTSCAHLRAGLARPCARLGLRAAVAGTHWCTPGGPVSPGAATSTCTRRLRELARREPTFALHVHVAVPDPELAVRALQRHPRAHRVLLALAANSPFTRGRDSGLASARTPVFQAFPRTACRASSRTYADYAEAIDVLMRCGAIPEPTFIWWDVRLQPRLGTLEVRVMDAQTRIRDTAALAALVQCLVRIEALQGMRRGRAESHADEVLDENRFLAARDGINAPAARPPARPLRARLGPAGHAGGRLLAARPRARLRARAGDAGPPRRGPRSDPPARDRL